MVVLSTSHVELFGQHEQYDKLAEALLDYPESVVIGGAQTLSRALDYCRIGFVTVVEDEPETDCDVRLGDTLGPEWVKEELAHKKAGTCFVEEGGEDEYNFSIYLVTRVGK